MELDTIHNSDSIENLCYIDDEAVDLVILDPDYDKWEEYCQKGLIYQAVRVLKKTGNIICFTKQPFDFELRKEIDYIFRREFVWTFENGGAWVSNKMPLVSTQKIFWLTPTSDFYFNPRTGLKYNTGTKDFKRKNKVFGGYNGQGKSFEKSEDGVWIRDHYHYNKPSAGKIPAKPIELMEIFIRCLSKDGDIVLDPFMGSGTTAIACIKNNRRFIGYEYDKECYELCTKRIKTEQSQLKLF